HYNVIAAFIRSLRGGDPDAAVYWMMRMLEAGEDPLFVARRMVIFAAEDVGNAEPQALQVAVAVKDAVHFVGLPEGRIPLAQAATFLATCPKSNASYRAMLAAAEDVRQAGPLPAPLPARTTGTGTDARGTRRTGSRPCPPGSPPPPRPVAGAPGAGGGDVGVCRPPFGGTPAWHLL